MWRRIALSVAMAWVPTTAGLAQDRLPATLFSQCGAVKLEIVLGRLTAVPRHCGALRVATPDEDTTRPRELLVVNSESGAPLLRYERVDARQSITIEIIDQQQFLIRTEVPSHDGGQSFEFNQSAQGGVQLVLHEGNVVRKVTAPSVWHLLLAERLACETTLLPIVNMLRPGWDLASRAEQVEAELFAGASLERPVSRQELEQLMSDLNAPQFRRRETADRQLRSYGPMVLPYLNTFVEGEQKAGRRLSGEQRARILRIRQSIAADVEDTPERVAQWLADDVQVWLGLLKHRDLERRRVASVRLAALHPPGIQFDPDGDESNRQKQLAQLRLQFAPLRR